MRKMDMEFAVIHSDDLIEIKLEGKITLDMIASLDSKMKSVIDTDSNVIVNFEKVDYIDSSSLGIFITYYMKIYKKSHFVFAGIKNEIRELFKITGLLDKVPIYNSFVEAEEALKKL